MAASQNDSSSSLDSLAQHLGISSEELENAARAAAVDQVDAALEEAGSPRNRQTSSVHASSRASCRRSSGPASSAASTATRGMGSGPFLDGRGLPRLTAAAEPPRGRPVATDVAEAEGKSVDGLKRAILAEAKRSLDEAVAEEDLTRGQRTPPSSGWRRGSTPRRGHLRGPARSPRLRPPSGRWPSGRRCLLLGRRGVAPRAGRNVKGRPRAASSHCIGFSRAATSPRRWRRPPPAAP